MREAAVAAIDALRRTGHKIATAESLTGGLLCATLVDVPGASDVVCGGVVAYTPQVKIDLLGVSREVLAEHGSVHDVTAVQMASGAVEQVSGATLGISTTGVAGPDPSEGVAVGTVYVAIAEPHEATVHDFLFEGDRRSIREQTVDAALSLLIGRLGESTDANHG